MNSRALVKPSKQLKDSVTLVGLYQNATERAREIYQSQIKRAESDYFERIKRAGEIITGAGSTPVNTPEQPVPANGAQEQPPSEPAPATQ